MDDMEMTLIGTPGGAAGFTVDGGAISEAHLELATAIYRCLNNALELFLFTTLLHNLVLATPRSTPIQQLCTYAAATVAWLREESSPEQVRPWDPLAIATSAQVGVRSKQVMNSPLNQYYVTCMLVSRPIEDTTRYRG